MQDKIYDLPSAAQVIIKLEFGNCQQNNRSWKSERNNTASMAVHRTRFRLIM